MEAEIKKLRAIRLIRDAHRVDTMRQSFAENADPFVTREGDEVRKANARKRRNKGIPESKACHFVYQRNRYEPPPEVIEEARRAMRAQRSLTQELMGDPAPHRSALGRNGVVHESTATSRPLCAQIVDEYTHDHWGSGNSDEVAQEIAHRIRALAALKEPT